MVESPSGRIDTGWAIYRWQVCQLLLFSKPLLAILYALLFSFQSPTSCVSYDMSRTSERNHEQSRCLSLASALHEDEDEDGAAGNANDDMQELLFEQSPSTLSTSEARAFFFSHALSTWNARSYEFAAILFTASAFPDSLAMSSIRGLVTTFAALLLSSAIGSAIDSSRSRLTPLLSSIVINRLSVLAACLAWYGLFCLPTEGSGQDSPVRLVFFAAALALGIVEKLSGIANMIASERDWLPAMADETGPYTLTSLNSVMRRIDLICKLVAPIIISWLISVTTLRIGIVFTGILSGLSCGAEVSNALRVWRSNARLRSDRGLSRDMSGPGALLSNTSRLLASARAQLRNVQYYFSVDVWIPSLTLALLYLSALSYAATLTTYLLNVGFSLMAITIARTCGSVIEVSSTFIAPVWIRQLAYTRHHRPHGDGVDEPLASSEGYDQKTEAPHSVGLQRSGLWGITLQWICLVSHARNPHLH